MHSFIPHRGKVFVTDLERGPRATRAGIIIPDDDMTVRGVRDRWAQVWAVGEGVDDIRAGEWVLVKHGRWSHGIDVDTDVGTVRVWHVDYPDSVLLASETDPRATTQTTL